MDAIVRTDRLDLAKSLFHVYCADDQGRHVEFKVLRRAQVFDYFRRLPHCVVAMDTFTGVNWWCRQLRALGHEARLILSAYLKPYVKSHKNDALGDGSAYHEAQRPPAVGSPLYEGAIAMLRTRQRDEGGKFPATYSREHEKSMRVVTVGFAQRNARIFWSMVWHGTKYQNRTLPASSGDKA